jgi:CheY-like chemotaxis protein
MPGGHPSRQPGCAKQGAPAYHLVGSMAHTSHTSQGMSPLRGISILLIEDNPDVRDLTVLVLERRGARMTVAENGAEGFTKLRADCPDLVLCDLIMPVMDGFEFARRVRQTPECAHARLVALTSRRDDDAYVRALAAGFDAFLEKPFYPEPFESLATPLCQDE